MVRLRAPSPTDFQVVIDGTVLQEVKDSVPHPELDGPGFFAIDSQSVIDANDPSSFFVLRLVLPKSKRDSSTPFSISLINESLDTSLPPNQRSAPPAIIQVRGFDPRGFDTGMVKPGGVFFAGDNNSDPNSIIFSGVTIAGWVEGPYRHAPGNAPNGETEDWHYDLHLDNEFIERNYGPDGFQLAGLMIPGRPEHGIFDQTKPVPLISGAVNASIFMMPGEGDMTVELNSWHKPQRGPKPPGWIDDPDNNFGKDAWPFIPARPFGIQDGDSDIGPDDYVIVSGTLLEDPAHLHGGGPPDPVWVMRNCLDQHIDGQGGWLEIHPTDSIRVIRNKTGMVGPPAIRKHVVNFAACDNSAETLLTPFELKPALPIISTLQFREFVDSRFTSPNVTNHVAEPVPNCTFMPQCPRQPRLAHRTRGPSRVFTSCGGQLQPLPSHCLSV